jgi:hypothetical protein
MRTGVVKYVSQEVLWLQRLLSSQASIPFVTASLTSGTMATGNSLTANALKKKAEEQSIIVYGYFQRQHRGGT